MPNLRQKLNDVRAKHANLESKIAQQERTISSNKNRLTRLRTLEKEEQRFIEKNSNLEREWQRLEVKAQNLLNKESGKANSRASKGDETAKAFEAIFISV